MNTEELQRVLDRTLRLIENADTKNNIFVVIATGIVMALFLNSEFLNLAQATFEQGDIARATFLVFAILAFLIYLVTLIISLKPVDVCEDDSRIFAGVIAKYPSYKIYKKSLEDPDYSLDDDLAAEIHVTSKIFQKKILCNKIASYALLTMIASIIVYAFLTVTNI